MAILSQSEVDGMNHDLAERLNEQMKKAVLPVTVFVGIETVIGFFGNLVVLYVFLFRYHSCNFRYFVLCLAMTDIISTLTTMPGEIMTQLYWYVYPEPFICKIKSFFNVLTVSSETLCFLSIAVDRYRKVCKPHGWQIQPRIAKVLCIGINVLSFLIALPAAFYWGTHDEEEFHYNRTIITTICEKDKKYINTYKPLLYSISLQTILCISLACMFVLYIIIARKFIFSKKETIVSAASSQGYGNNGSVEHKRSNEELSSTDMVISNEASLRVNQDNRRETFSMPVRRHGTRMNKSKVRRKTLIMFILTLIFIVTTIIYLTMVCLIAKGILSSLSDTEKAIYFFFFRFYFINHVINPIVYGVLDSKFRASLSGIRKLFQTST